MTVPLRRAASAGDDAVAATRRSELSSSRSLELETLPRAKRTLHPSSRSLDLDPVAPPPPAVRRFELRTRLEDDSEIEQAEARRRRRLRFAPRTSGARLFVLLDDPASSPAARVVSLLVLALICLSCAGFVLETLPSARVTTGEGGPESEPETHGAFAALEAVCVALFTVEYAARVATVHLVDVGQWLEETRPGYAELQAGGSGAARTLRYALMPLNVVDFLAIAPWYAALAAGGGGGVLVVRVLRLVRVFRVFRLGKFYSGCHLFLRVLTKSRDALLLLLFFLGLFVVLVSSLMFYAERGEWTPCSASDLDLVGCSGGYYARPTADGLGTEPSPFVSIPVAFWWCVVTVTTVGYGDLYPTTTLGRFIAAAAIVMGILFMAAPLSIVAANFASEYAEIHEVAQPPPPPQSQPAPQEVEELRARLEAQEALARELMEALGQAVQALQGAAPPTSVM